MLNVVVLGAGPAGLLAAHTALGLGAGVAVWSLAEHGREAPQKSELHGCQYLHAPVVDGSKPVSVSYQLNGSVEEYRAKVYGDGWQGSVSPDEYGPEEEHLAWDLREAYDLLWEFWQHRIAPVDRQDALDHRWVKAFLSKADVDMVISTIPRTALCAARLQGGIVDGREHLFHTQNIWAMGATHNGFQDGTLEGFDCPDNTVMCDGTKGLGWYRKSRVFGVTTVEWPWRDGRKPPIRGVVPVQKPLSHTCTCWEHENRVAFVGRYGRWQKGYLVHQVIDDVRSVLGNTPARLF
jgi:hypothetical protein